MFKVPVFKISRGQSTQTPLDGLYLWLSNMPPLLITLCGPCTVLSIVLSLEIKDNVV